MRGPLKIRAARKSHRSCVSCKSHFIPHLRLGIRQKTCGKDPCRRKQRAEYRKKYRRENPKIDREYELKRRSARSPDYWKSYRQKNSAYSDRNRAQAKLRNHLAKVGLQRQLDIVQLVDPPEKLASVVGFATSHRSLLEQCLCKVAA